MPGHQTPYFHRDGLTLAVAIEGNPPLEGVRYRGQTADGFPVLLIRIVIKTRFTGSIVSIGPNHQIFPLREEPSKDFKP
jgi:hypothetical protein